MKVKCGDIYQVVLNMLNRMKGKQPVSQPTLVLCAGCYEAINVPFLTLRPKDEVHFRLGLNFYILNSLETSSRDLYEIYCKACYQSGLFYHRFTEKHHNIYHLEHQTYQAWITSYKDFLDANERDNEIKYERIRKELKYELEAMEIHQ
jgi:hypothetical protein